MLVKHVCQPFSHWQSNSRRGNFRDQLKTQPDRVRITDLNDRSIVLCQNVRMRDEHSLTLRRIDQARGDLYAIADDLDFLKAQLARLPNRAYVGRTVLMATASTWALVGAVALLLMR